MTVMAKLDLSMMLWKRRVSNTTMRAIRFLNGTTTQSIIVKYFSYLATAVNVPGNVKTDECNVTDGNELSDPIPILRTKFYTLEKTECSFCQSGMPTNYYCTLECDNGQRSLDGKIKV